MKSELATEQFVYPQRTVANAIADRMSKLKGVKHGVVQLPQGFKVTPIQVLPAYVPPSKPKPVQTTSLQSVAAPKEGEQVFNFVLIGEGITYITVLHEGKQKAFGKSTLLGWSKNDDGTIALKMTTAVAKKRGLLPA